MHKETAEERLKRYLSYIFNPWPAGPCVICGGQTTGQIRGKPGDFEFVHEYSDRDSAGCRDVWQYRFHRDQLMTVGQFIEYHKFQISQGDMRIPEDLAHYELIDEVKDFYHDYKSYIASNEWRIRADAMKREAKYKCERCNRGADRTTLHIHHKHYKTLYKERRQDLEVLCNQCHKNEHNRHGGWR